MKKRLLALFLSMALLCGLTVPAAAQSADDRLAAVTAKVKETLDLDTEKYPTFYGDLSEDILAPSWYLEWTGDDGTLSISASEDGKILSYHLYNEEAQTWGTGAFAPSFPAGDQVAAKAAAQRFLDRVLTGGETATMKERTVRLGASSYRFYGEILLNGLPAGLSYSIAVRCEDNVVTSFSRDDLNGTVMGGVLSAKTKITQAQARTALRDTLALRLEYVLPQDGGKQAVLRYLPESGDEYYVDAATGELVNLTELSRDVEKGGMAGGSFTAAAEDAGEAPAAAGSLSQAEQQGAEKLKGVLSRDDLDARARAISALGLEQYTLSGADYTVARDGDESGETQVTAALRYGQQVNGTSWRRTVTLDARTGELIRVYSSAWMPEEAVERTVSRDTALTTAQAFLKDQCGDQFSKMAIYGDNDALEGQRTVSHSFTFAQKVNGYFFPENSIQVGVDATDGSISLYEKQFDDAVTFDSPAGILTADQALDAWLDTYTVQLEYVMVPAAVDYSKPEYQPLADYGVSYLYKLVLGYRLERQDYLLGIDAKTGQPVRFRWTSEDQGITYGDLSGHWAGEQIGKLAKYGVGYTGGSFQPDKALTQLDLMALLASTEGYLYDGTREGAADELYEYAISLGLLRREDRADGRVLTRTETVRCILDAVGYGPIARLEGIFRTKFTDDASIPRADYGYVALAQGLGVVSGDTAGRFRPNASATRAQAAVMLCNLMSR
ncbi:MAG: S-layer homology domain-containing protein [Dysosmobacter sp.]